MDDLDLRIVAELQRDGRATWSQLATAVGSSGTTVARRVQRLLSEGAIRIVGGVDPLRVATGYPVLVRVTVAPGQVGAVIDAVADREDIRFLAILTGAADMVFELIVPSQAELARILLEELQVIPGIESTTTATIMRHFKLSHHAQQTSTLPEPGTAPPLDVMDRRIVRELSEDGRIAVASLADRLDISESMARRRLDALLTDGRVTISTLFDANMMGYQVELLVFLKVDLGRLAAVAAALGEQPEVRYLAAAAGDIELVAELLLRDQGDLYRFATEVLGGLEGIRGSDMALELVTVKRAYVRLP